MDYSNPPSQATTDRLNHTVSNDIVYSYFVSEEGLPLVWGGEIVYARSLPMDPNDPCARKSAELENRDTLAALLRKHRNV